MNQYQALKNDVVAFLQNKKIEIEFGDLTPMSQFEISEFKEHIGLSLPSDFEEYLTTFGFGPIFSYNWEHAGVEEVFGLGLSFKDEVEAQWDGAHELNEAVASGNGDEFGYDKEDQATIELANIRKNWLPIYGIGGGGYVLSLDTNSPKGAIVYQDIHYGLAEPESSSIVIANSFEEWINNWGRYCFSYPLERNSHADWASYASGKCGEFDWSPSNFSENLDRGLSV